ncbi:helix-turn-helix domain-containing protein [Candidatus Roizmanbacteria bacterium]|nr:helix-turn-helix domain-containing protein [Candidatus Roizmanbacteria bacterium]
MSETSHLEKPDPLGFLVNPANIRPDKKHTLIDGTDISLVELLSEDINFLSQLATKAMQQVGYFVLLRLVRGPGAYPLKGSIYITKTITSSVLFRVAEDIVSRAACCQGVLIPSQQMVDKFENLLTVPSVADILDVTRVAVNQMIRSGILKGERYGRTFLIRRGDLEQFCASLPGSKCKRP